MRMGGEADPDPQSARPAGGAQGAAKHTFHSFPAVNTLFNALAQPPRLRHGRLERPEGLGRRRHGGAGRRRPSCGWRRPAARSARATACRRPRRRRRCNPVDQHRLHRHHRPADAVHRASKLLDDDGNEVPLGQPGEIAIKGPQVMAGYWQRPDETAKVDDGRRLLQHAATSASMDERGYFRIVDRKKDMILVSGFNVYPNEVEDVVAQMPGVLECAAVGVPDEKSGEAVKLFIVQAATRRSPRQQVRDYCRRQPHRLQAAAGHRVPHRAAEDARRQDPAPRAARQEMTRQ